MDKITTNPYKSGDRVYYYDHGPTDQGIVVGPIVSPDHVTVIWERDNDISEHSLELLVAVKSYEMVHHTPKWEPGHLPIDAAGNTKPGFICVHELENGNGQCGGNVFRIEDEVGDHCCVVYKE